VPGPAPPTLCIPPTTEPTMVACQFDGAWRVRDGTTGRMLKEVKAFNTPGVPRSPLRLACSPWPAKTQCEVYDTATWKEVARFDGH